MNFSKVFKRPWTWAIALVVCLLVATLWTGYRVTKMPSYNCGGSAPVSIYIYPGDDWSAVSGRIPEGVSVRNGRDLSAVGLLGGEPRPGHYLIRPDETTLGLYRILSRGLQAPVRITFTTTREVGQLWKRLSDQLLCDSAAIAEAMTDRTLLDSLGVEDSTLAYYLIPDTYEVYWTESARAITARLARESKAFWSDKRRSQAEELGMTPREVITLASIINEESAKSDEYRTIAGLYLNRLHRGMALQSDPTVLFALGDRSIRRVLHKHLKVDSPYNTYLHLGLPPGPIRIPSASAIDAVLCAEQHDYIYMCAKEDFSGRHNFAASYSEHMRNARAYASALNECNIH